MQGDGIDLLSLSAHKLYGPKGVGALYIRRKNPRVRLTAIFDGGAHERGFRSGTLNVPGIVATGMAWVNWPASTWSTNACASPPSAIALQSALQHRIENVLVNGDEKYRLPHVANLSFPGLDANALLNALPDIAVSSGSACTSASMAASHVLMAMGLGEDRAHTAIRFSLGRFTTIEDIDYTVARFVEVVPRLRAEASTADVTRTLAPAIDAKGQVALDVARSFFLKYRSFPYW